MHLMNTQSELLVGALCDMLRTLVVSFPPHTPLPHIFSMAYTLVQQNIRATLKLWYFLSQEYSPAQGMDALV